MKKPGIATSMVYPSARLLATNWVPIVPPAPALLITTTGCLRMRSIASANGRACKSATPPGGCGTTN